MWHGGSSSLVGSFKFCFPFPTSSSGTNFWKELVDTITFMLSLKGLGDWESFFYSHVTFFLTSLISSMLLLYWHLPNTYMSNAQFSFSAQDAKVCHFHLNDPALQTSNIKWLSSLHPVFLLYVFNYWPLYHPSTKDQRLVTSESYFMILSFSKLLPRAQVLF